MLNLQIPMTTLSKEEYQQYARHLVLDNIGLNGQKRLKNAKVLIVGAGGLGCPAILYLSASGIGCIGIIDHDKINLSNLNRQIIYNIENINEYKTDCSKLKIKQINQKCRINTYTYQLTKINAKHIIQHYDIIIDATDNFNTRYIIDKICYIYHKIHIYGAINKYEGQVSVFNYQNNIRYSDIYPENLQLKNHNCNDIGILGIMTGLVGTLQATECIKIILGIGNIMNGRILTYNLLNTSFKIVKFFPRKQNKITIRKISYPFIKIPILKLNNTKYLNNKKIIIIDVRQAIEFNFSHLKKSINIPLKYWQNKTTIQFILMHFKQQIIIIYCNNESRSTIASDILYKYNQKNFILNK